ncbi:P-loop containing nucleoside triphosphate hydrolase protein [Catenaria anguillulae PL171]|uniref:p-loop containing nucleoside triphosphate hydrolase protein n=1 Tax=Catenaria anguillulae PL171 TaxID=765915 RepID=A0A1Y2H9I2_9FUNG|nr:P-loop containing nucleoside triphosphate hydrolase protein [Catenaria anguillulae PL171]
MTASTSTSPRTSSAHLTPQRQLKILLLGSSGAGKTALALRYAQNCFNPHQKSTIGVDFFTKQVTVPDGSTVSINIWDTAGQERFHSLVESFFRGADACILVMDPTQPPRESLASLTYWHAKVMHHLGPVASASHFPFLVVATKSDLDASVPLDHVKQWCASERGVAQVVHTSAVTGEGVNDAFVHAAQLAVDYHRVMEVLEREEVEREKSRRRKSKRGSWLASAFGLEQDLEEQDHGVAAGSSEEGLRYARLADSGFLGDDAVRQEEARRTRSGLFTHSSPVIRLGGRGGTSSVEAKNCACG